METIDALKLGFNLGKVSSEIIYLKNMIKDLKKINHECELSIDHAVNKIDEIIHQLQVDEFCSEIE